MYIIINAFHWIGYHLVEEILSNGEKVIGVDDKEDKRKEQLSMYIGRNAHFQWYENISDMLDNEKISIHDHIFAIEAEHLLDDYLIKKTNCIAVCTRSVKPSKEMIKYVEVPGVYGKWMPNLREWLSDKHDRLLLQTQQSEEVTVSISDFVKALLQLSQATISPHYIKFKNKFNNLNYDEAKSTIYLINRYAQEEQLRKLSDHFRQNSEYYR